MEQSQKYFIFNKERDYLRGFCRNMEWFPEGIRMRDTHLETGYFFSRLLDSREKGTCWHRMKVGMTEQNDSSIHIRIYVSESECMNINGDEMNIEEFIHQDNISPLFKLECMKSLCVRDSYIQEDLLLHDVIGRYLWFVIEFHCHGEFSPEIHSLQIFFPKSSWLDYLPEVYQQDRKSADFLERFLAVFQTLYSEMTDEINHVSRYMDPEVVSQEFLLWLSEWVALEDVYLWTEEQLRYLLKNSLRMYRELGTVSYLKEMVWLYTGSKPYVIENHQLEQFQSNYKVFEHLRKLYGDSPYKFSIVVDSDKIATYQKQRAFIQMVENAKPAYMECNVVILKPYIFLGHYSYLGINSRLERYQDVQLNGVSSIPFTAITSNQ